MRANLGRSGFRREDHLEEIRSSSTTRSSDSGDSQGPPEHRAIRRGTSGSTAFLYRHRITHWKGVTGENQEAGEIHGGSI